MTSWIEINRTALRHNYRAIQTLIGQTKMIGVVKANAYGCGAPECARVFADEGAAMLAVTRVDEALELRESGVQTPILLLAPALPDEYESVVRFDLTAALGSLEEAMKLSELAVKLGRTARVQLKVNTGMNRFGAAPEAVGEIVARARKLPFLEVTGAFTHLANAGAPEPGPTLGQLEIWDDATHGLKEMTLHVANSSALVRFPQMRLNAARPGTLLYGQFPDGLIARIGAENGLTLVDPWTAKTRVVAVQKLAAGQKFGYGSEWTAPRASTLAITGIGWADGLTMEPNARALSPLDVIKAGLTRAARLKKNSNSGRMVTIDGRKAPIVGRVAMQTCAIDATDLPEVKVGDEVELPMRRLSARQGLARVYVDRPLASV